DGLTEMVPAILAGEDRSATADALEANLRAAARRRDPLEADRAADAPPASPPAAEAPTPVGEGPPVRRPFRSDGETIMVPVRLVGESAAAHLRMGRMLGERLTVDPGTVSEFRDLSLVLNDLQERTMRARMVPVATVTDQLHRTVRDLARAQGKDVRWEVRGEETELDRSVPRQLADPLLHLVR